MFVEELRPSHLDATARLDAAFARFGSTPFSRKNYLALHKSIGPATASRDLHAGVEAGTLRVRGDKATARYHFAAHRAVGRKPRS